MMYPRRFFLDASKTSNQTLKKKNSDKPTSGERPVRFTDHGEMSTQDSITDARGPVVGEPNRVGHGFNDGSIDEPLGSVRCHQAGRPFGSRGSALSKFARMVERPRRSSTLDWSSERHTGIQRLYLHVFNSVQQIYKCNLVIVLTQKKSRK